MRIPSSFNDDNLYRQRGRRPTANQSQRRLFRLLLAMALVIAVMGQAGNPQIYEVFFSQPPPPQDTSADAAAGLTDTGGASGAPAGSQPAVNRVRVLTPHGVREVSGMNDTEQPAGEPLRETVARLDETTAKRMMQALANLRRGEPQPVGQSWLSEDLVDALAAAAQATDASPHSAGKLPTQPGGEDEDRSAPGVADRDWLQPSLRGQLQEALDRWAIERVDPASIWKASDALAFYRLLEEPAPPWLRRQSAAQASVISLLQQPEVYLHRRVLVPGSVARAIHREAAENPFGVTEFWELWLRPRDGSEHPIVFFTGDVPPEIARVGPDAVLSDGPPVWIEGVYLKRLAYRSAGGRQLAPALVGSLRPVLPTTPVDVVATSPLRTNGWLLLGVAALLGTSLALLIFFQTRKEAARTRALRSATDHGDAAGFLTKLSDDRAQQPGVGE